MDLQFVQGECLFTKINKVPKQYDYLTEDIDTEVIIVGGGVTGAILGYYFSKKGIDTVLLEKKRMAYGSTSITTALLQYELDSNVRDLEQYTNYENIIRSYKLGIKALGEIEEFISEYGNKCRYKKRDTLLFTEKKVEIGELEEEYSIRRSNGINVDLLLEHNNSFSFNLRAGVYSKDGGAELDPYLYAHQLLEVGCNNGLRAYENTEVLEVRNIDEGVEVITNYSNKVKGKIIIVATGYNTSLFTKRNFGTTTTAFNIVTKPVRSFDGWVDQTLIRDNNDPYNYFRTTYDNRIIAGGEDISFIPDIFNEKAAEEKYKILEARVKSMFPLIKDIEIEYKYCGAFTSTQDNLGFLGKDPNNSKQWYCLGYGANGILFAILGGVMLSELYCGNYNEDLELFRVDRFN